MSRRRCSRAGARVRVAQRDPRQALVPEAAGRARPDAVRRRRRDAARHDRARGRGRGRGGQSGRRRSPATSQRDPCRRRARGRRGRGARRARRRWSTSRRSAPIRRAVALRPDQGRGRGGGARGLPAARRSCARRSVFGREDQFVNRFAGMIASAAGRAGAARAARGSSRCSSATSARRSSPRWPIRGALRRADASSSAGPTC